MQPNTMITGIRMGRAARPCETLNERAPNSARMEGKNSLETQLALSAMMGRDTVPLRSGSREA